MPESPTKSDREFLEGVRDELMHLETKVQNRAGDQPEHADLEALLRLAWGEAARRVDQIRRSEQMA